MTGSVRRFGSDGWGVVETTTGETYPFHSTAITDGSRQIEPGTEVSFQIVPGRRGRWEAAALVRR